VARLDTYVGEDTPVTVEFDSTPYDPGRISGPPEYCYPPEGGECEITAVYFAGLPTLDISAYLSQADLELLLEKCYEAIPALEAEAKGGADIDMWESKQMDKEYNYDRGDGYGH